MSKHMRMVDAAEQARLDARPAHAARHTSAAVAEAVADAEALAVARTEAVAEGVEPADLEPAIAHEPDAAPADNPAEKNGGTAANVGRSAAMMSLLVIVSRITGFFRTWGQAYALGVTVVSSCYTVANNLPNQLYELVMGGMLVTAFLPVYLSVKEKAGREGASRYASNLVSLVVLIMGAVAVLGCVFSAQVIWTQSFGATKEFDADLAEYFFRFFVIEVVLYALSSILSGVLNAERDYFWSNAAPIFNNFVCTASFFAYAFFAKSNPSLAIMCLAVGNPLGVAVQVVLQIPSLRRHGIRITPFIDLHDPAIRETLSIGVPSLIVTAASFVTVSVQNSSALSVVATGSSIAYYARLWYTLPYAILAIPITTAMFTELSESVSKGDMEGYKRGVSMGTGQIMFFLVPFALYLIVFAVPLVTLLAAGKFSADDIQVTAQYLQVLALSLPFYGICTYLQKVCSSLRRMGVFAWASVVAGVVQVVFCLVLTPMFGLNMVAMSSLFFFIAVDLVTFVNLRGQLGNMGLRAVLSSGIRSLALGVAGAALGAIIVFALSHFAGPIDGRLSRALVYTMAGGFPALFVTFGLAIATRMPESAMIRSLARKFTRR